MADPNFFDPIRISVDTLASLDWRPYHFAVQPFHFLIRMTHVVSQCRRSSAASACSTSG